MRYKEGELKMRNAVRAMCVAKNRDKKGYIVDYTLVDGKGNTVRMKSSEIKERIRAGQLEVMNLKIDMAGRLIDAPKAEFKQTAKAPAKPAPTPVQTTPVKPVEPVEQQAPEKDILKEWLYKGGMHSFIYNYRREHNIMDSVYDGRIWGKTNIPTPPVAEKFMAKIVDDLYNMAKEKGVKIIDQGDNGLEVPDSFMKLCRIVKADKGLEVLDMLKDKEDIAVFSCVDDYLVTDNFDQAVEFLDLQDQKVTKRWSRYVGCNKLAEVFFWKYIAKKFNVYNSDCENVITDKIKRLYNWMQENKDKIMNSHSGDSITYVDYFKDTSLMVLDFFNNRLIAPGKRTNSTMVADIIKYMNEHFGMKIQRSLDDDESIISPIYLAVNYNIPWCNRNESEYEEQFMKAAKDFTSKVFINGKIEDGVYRDEIDDMGCELKEEVLSALDNGNGILIEDDGSISIIGANSTKLADCIKKNAVVYRDKNFNEYLGRYENYAEFLVTLLEEISRLPRIKSLYNTSSGKIVYFTKGDIKDMQDVIKSTLVNKLLKNDKEMEDEDNIYVTYPEEVALNFKKVMKILEYNEAGTPEETEIPDDILDAAFEEYKNKSIFNFDEE